MIVLSYFKFQVVFLVEYFSLEASFCSEDVEEESLFLSIFFIHTSSRSPVVLTVELRKFILDFETVKFSHDNWSFILFVSFPIEEY